MIYSYPGSGVQWTRRVKNFVPDALFYSERGSVFMPGLIMNHHCPSTIRFMSLVRPGVVGETRTREQGDHIALVSSAGSFRSGNGDDRRPMATSSRRKMTLAEC